MKRQILSFAVLISLVSASAAAQELSEADRRVAQEHFERGTLAFERGDYGDASAEFRAAYALTHHADLLYNIYSAQERNGQLEEAAEALEGYLRDTDPAADRREALELRLQRLRDRIERAQREEIAEAEAERERAAAELEAAWEERAARERAGEEQGLRRSELRAGHATSDALFVSGAVAMAVGGLGLVSFGVFAGLSTGEDQSLASSCGRDAGRVCSEEDVATLRTFNTAADVSWIAGVGLAAVGAAILWIGESLRPAEEPPPETVRLLPIVSPSGAGAMLGGAF